MKSSLMRPSIATCVFLAGCATAPPAPAPTITYGDDYWNARDCATVDEPVQGVCADSHRRAGLAVGAVIPRLTPTPEQAADSLDGMLASWLKDPRSAIQYKISRLLNCDAVVNASSIDRKARGCMCYTVNAKNSFGGYTGSKYGVAEILQMSKEGNWAALNVPDVLVRPDAIAACGPTQEREASSITSKVR